MASISSNASDIHVADDGSTITYSSGDISWVLTSTALVALMAFGVSFLESGLLRRKNSLSMLFMGLASFAIVTVQWFLFGFSLCFSDTGTAFIGNFKHAAFTDVLWQPAPTSRSVPRITFALYQLTFAAITPMIAIGATGERGRILPAMVFVFLWSTFNYDFVAAWTWSANGFFQKFGVLDFAGGGVVHMTSGTAALAYSYWLGKRNGYGTIDTAYRPSSIQNIVLGTAFLIVGWLGFNGGSELAGNIRASMASFVTLLAAMASGLVWMIMDLRFEGKFSTVSLCTGILTGLIAITPASGFVQPWAALVIGIISAILCNLATSLKFLISCDDNMDIFATHAIGGFIGNLLTGIFADKKIIALDGLELAGGAISGNPVQIAKQLAYSGAIFAWTFAVTSAIVLLLDRIPGLSLRVGTESEREGIDLNQMNELLVDVDPAAQSAYPVSFESVTNMRSIAGKARSVSGLVSPASQNSQIFALSQ